MLDDPVGYIAGAGHDKRVLFGALLELLLIIANIGTAVVIVPIMRRFSEELSIGYVTARIFECTFILVGIVSVLGIITLRNQAAGASEGTVAYTLAAIKDWTFLLGPGWIVGLGNGLILGYLMYRTGLVPQRATWLGLVGGPLIIISGTVIMFGGNHPSSTLHSLQAVVTIPEAAWELFLGVYCTSGGSSVTLPILAVSPSWVVLLPAINIGEWMNMANGEIAGNGSGTTTTRSSLMRWAGYQRSWPGSVTCSSGYSIPPTSPSSVTTTRWEIVHIIACAMSFFGLLGWQASMPGRRPRPAGLGWSGTS